MCVSMWSQLNKIRTTRNMYFHSSSHTGYLCTSRDARRTNHDRIVSEQYLLT